GTAVSIALAFAGGPLGGNVNQIEPTLDFKTFRKSPLNPKHIIGVHLAARYLTGYGGKVAPPFNRFYMGGENDIRGFDIWAISPFDYLPTSSNVPLVNNDGSPIQQRVIQNGVPTFVNASTNIPTYQLVFPGGDTYGVANVEYRIPIFGPVTLAAFADA